MWAIVLLWSIGLTTSWADNTPPEASVVADQAPLRFTVVPIEGRYTDKAQLDRFAAYLGDALQRPVHYLESNSYSQAIEAFTRGSVDLAWFGALSGLQARHEVPGSQVIATSIEDRNFQTYLIGSSVTKLNIMPSLDKTIFGFSMAFVTPESTSGYLMPLYHLGKIEEQPLTKVKKSGFTGNHFRMLQMIEVGHYDLGWIDSRVWHRYAALGRINPRRVKLLWLSPPFVDNQWSLRGGFRDKYGTGFRKQLVDALAKLRDPDIMQAFARSQFVPANDSAYDHVIPIAQAYDLLPND